MIDFGTVSILMRKEIRDARRNRWLLLYGIVFAALSLALAWFALAGGGNYGLAGFGRTSASLINLILLIVPLMGLTLGAQSLTQEREKGTLAYLLAQPINQKEILLGKYLGLSLALVSALCIGFGLTALLIASNGGMAQIGSYLGLMVLAALLAMVTLSIGFLIATLVDRSATAVGMALFIWLLLVFVGDLGLMGTSIVLRLNVGTLFGFALVNPLQLFKIATILALRDNLEVLGPAGIYAVRTYGGSLLYLLLFLLALWVLSPLYVAGRLFSKRGAL